MTGRPELRVRLATASDAASIADIHNQGIEERIATFETALRSAQDVEAQLTEKGDRYPTVVVERDGRIVAWAGAGPYRARPAYTGVAEHSVYVARHARGIGAGRAALDALAREYEARGFWKLVSRIFPRTRAASPCTSAPDSGSSACTGATASSMASGGTASSSRSCWARGRRPPPTPPPLPFSPLPPLSRENRPGGVNATPMTRGLTLVSEHPEVAAEQKHRRQAQRNGFISHTPEAPRGPPNRG